MSNLDSSIYLQGSYIRIASNNDNISNNQTITANDNSLRNSCDRVESIQRIIDDPFLSIDKTKLICKPCISDIERKIEQSRKLEKKQNQQLQTFLNSKHSIQNEKSISSNDTIKYDEEILVIEEECRQLEKQENELKYILENNKVTISQLKSTINEFQNKEKIVLDSYEEDQLNQYIDNVLNSIDSSDIEFNILQKIK